MSTRRFVRHRALSGRMGRVVLAGLLTLLVVMPDTSSTTAFAIEQDSSNTNPGNSTSAFDKGEAGDAALDSPSSADGDTSHSDDGQTTADTSSSNNSDSVNKQSDGEDFSASGEGRAPAIESDIMPMAESGVDVRVRGAQTWFAYVGAGESLDVDFVQQAVLGSGWANEGTRIVVRNPNNAVVLTCTTSSNGDDCNYLSPVATTGGVYSISIEPPVGDANQSNGKQAYSWSIKVRQGGSEKTGRVWTEKYVINQIGSDLNDKRIDLTLWYQTEAGYTYQIDRTGFQGVDSAVTASAFGNVIKSGQVGECTSAHRSISDQTALNNFNAPNANLQAVGSPAWGCNATAFKIFFEAPNADLPEQVALPGGQQTWLLVAPPSALEVEDLTFTQTAAQEYTRAGTITFNVSPKHEGTAYVLIDVDNNSSFDDAVDRRIPVQVVSGVARPLAFDGLDGNGDPISLHSQFQIRVVVEETGEVHFTDGDVEIMAGGISVTRLNGTGAPDHRMSWDDSYLFDFRSETSPYNEVVRCGVLPTARTGDQVDSSSSILRYDLAASGPCSTSSEANPGDSAISPTQPNFGTLGNLAILDRWANIKMSAQADTTIKAATTLTLLKDLRDDAQTIDPAFELLVERGTTELASATASTRVNGTTVLSEKAGPALVNPNQVITLSEADPDLDQFTSSLECRVDGGADITVSPLTVDADSAQGTLTVPPAAQGKNITCTFINTLNEPELELEKVDAEDNSLKLAGATFQLWRDVNENGTLETDVDTMVGAEQTTAASGVINWSTGLRTGKYLLQETAAPTGYEISTPSVHAVTLVADKVTVSIENARLTGSVKWSKVDNQGHVLGGSEWKITGPEGSGSSELQVDDCEQAPCSGPDRDTRKGYFEVTGLGWGDYALVEMKAPMGYVLSTSVHPFTIGPAPASFEIDLDKIVNQQQPALSIPLTGGLGSMWFLIVGGMFLALLLGGALYRGRRLRNGLAA